MIASSQTDLIAASQTDLIAASQTDLIAASQTDLIAASQTDLRAASQTDLIAASQTEKNILMFTLSLHTSACLCIIYIFFKAWPSLIFLSSKIFMKNLFLLY